ncbi:MAG: bifunctional metallophosphatase/5'-nucleotidase [Defluviitaleaceae bacterium]|nr:bifunctional metallophosphatase/5'-nucleotidase [Defluviitaleaceae bacterium]
MKISANNFNNDYTEEEKSPKIKIYYTSDTHAHVVPNLLNIINSFEKDENTLIIDGGDTIQGSPLSMYLSSISNAEPFASVLNEAGYDYVTLGNHEFNYGKKYLQSFLGSLNAKCLCANMNSFPAYDIKEIAGFKIGIIGIITDFIPFWEREKHIEGFTFSDPFLSAKENLEKIKKEVDLTICLYHGGYERDVYTGEIYSETKENIGYKICDELDFDLVLTAHQHKPQAGVYINNTYTVQPPNYATAYLEIHIDFINGKPSFKSELKEARNDNYELPSSLKNHIEKADSWLNQPIGKLSKPLMQGDYLDMALNGSDIANFQNQVQLWATGAMYSSASVPNKISGLNEIVTIRDVVSTYLFPNNLIVLELDYYMLKEIVEHTASYFHYENGNISISKHFLQPKIAHYGYDYYTFPYEIDLTKKVGERVTLPFKKDEKITICVSNYRAGGTDGYNAYKRAKIIKEHQEYINDVIIEYFREHKNVEIVNYNMPKIIL